MSVTTILKQGRILVLNAGSSSLKFKTFDAATLSPEVSGIVERIGDAANSSITAKLKWPSKFSEKIPASDHVAALGSIINFLKMNVASDLTVQAVGHRIVHGLDICSASLLTEEVLSTIRKAVALAPLHNPPGLQGVEASVKCFGKHIPQASSPH